MSRKPCLLWKVLSRALLPASALLRKFLLHPVVLHPPALQVLQRLLHLDPLLPLGVLRHHRLLDLHQFVVVEIPTIELVKLVKTTKKCFGCWAVVEEDWLVEERLEDALLLFHVLVKVLQELVDLTCGFNIKLCGFEIMTNWNVSALNRSWEANHEWYNNCNTILTLQPLPIKGAACLVKRGVDRLHQVNDRQLRAIKFHQQCCQHSASASWHSWWQSSPTRSPHGNCKRTGCTPACCASSLAASAMSVFTKPINLVSLGAALSVPCSNTIWQPKPPWLQ